MKAGYIITFIFLLFSSIDSYGSHIVGANMRYECLGGNEYKIILNVFRNCDEQTPFLPTTTVRISYECSDISSNITLNQVFVEEVSQLCEEDLPLSSCGSGTGQYPGVTLYQYEGTATIGDAPGEYRINWNGIGYRSPTINLDNTGDDEGFSIYASIFKTSNECNNSAVLSNLWAPYFCLNQPANFNFSVFDIDQDSLVYSFTNAQEPGGFCTTDLSYASGYSSDSPISGISLNPLTGQVTFTPTVFSGLDAYTVTLRVDEYREGVLIGSSFIDIQFKVLPCDQPPPQGSSSGVEDFTGTAELVSPFEINMCTGQSFCFDYIFESPIPDATLELESNLNALFPSATVTTTGSNPLTATVCYTADPGDNGGVLVLDVHDDSCPVSGITSMSVLINVSLSVTLNDDIIICSGENTTLQATGDDFINWEVISGDPIVIGTNFSCANCPNPIVTPSQTTTYSATGGNISASCNSPSEVTVFVGLETDINFQAESCQENDGYITIEVLQGSGDYNLLINGNSTSLVNNEYSINNIISGNWDILLTDNISGCTVDTLISLESFSIPNANAGEDNTTCGLTYTCQAVPSSGIGSWTSNDPNITFADPSDPNTTATTNSFGAYTFTWSENNGPDCEDSDAVVVIFVPAPVIEAGEDDETCGFNYTLDAISNIANSGSWQPTDGISFLDSNDPNTSILGSSAGEYDIVWLEDDGLGCIVTDTVVITLIDIPTANAGMDDQVCSLTKVLEASPSVGAGVWTGDGDLSFADINDPNTEVTSIQTGEYGVTWQEDNNGCTNSDVVSIIFTEQPIANAGNDSILCGIEIDLNAIPSIGTGTWSATNNASFANPNNPNSEATVPDFGNFTFTWTEDNTGGCISSDQVTFTFLASPQANAGIGDSICGLGEIQLNAIPSNGIGQWSAPPGVTITDINDPNTTATGNLFGEFEIVWTENSMATSCFTEDEVQVGFIEQPIANAGLDNNVCGLETGMFASASAGTGTWTTSDSNITISDVNDPNTTVEVTEFGEYDLVWTEVNSFCTSTDDVILSFLNNSTPYAGEDESTCSDTYIMNATAVTGGIWISPELIDLGILDQAEVNNANAPLNFFPGAYGSYELTWFNSTCDEGDAVIITYLETPNSNAGMDFSICGNETMMSAVNDGWAGEWILPANITTMTGDQSDAIVTANTEGVYELIWEETNDICVNNDTVIVTFIDIPQPNVGDDDFNCGLDYTLSVISDGINGSWNSSGSLTYSPNQTSTTTNVTASSYGTQEIIWIETDPTGFCSGSDTLEVVFNNAPDTVNFNIECVFLNTQYIVTFDIIDGNSDSYIVTGQGTLSGSSYESDLIPNHENYSFIIDDDYGCNPLNIVNSFSCPSLTDAGSLNLDTLFICYGEMENVSIDTEPFEDANDVTVIVIHTNPGNMLGNVLDTIYNGTPIQYQNNFVPGTVYYASSVVGNELPNFDIDLNDTDLSVSVGVPVIFAPPPTLSTNQSSAIACADQNAVVDYVVNGVPNWDLEYTFNEEIFTVNDISEVQNNLVFMESGWLYFETITNQFCTTELYDSVLVTVYENPTADMVELVQFCTNEDYLIDIELTGEAPWSILFQDEDLLSPPLDTTVFSSTIQIEVEGAGYYWIANMSDQNCPNANGIDSVLVEILETPLSLAGADTTVCYGVTVDLGEDNEAGLTYEWTNVEWLDNPTDGTPSALIAVDTIVTIEYPFILTTSNTNCDVIDTVVVTVNPLPYDYTVSPTDPFCNGQSTQLSASGPYNFTWTPDLYLEDANSSITTTTATEDITYTLIVQDAVGCIDSSFVIVDVLETPNTNLEPSFYAGCLPSDVVIYNGTNILPGSECLWTFTEDDTFLSDSCDDLQLSLDELGEYDITLRVIYPNGCISETNIDTVITISTITADFGYTPNQPHISFDDIQFANQSNDAINWEWTIDNNIILTEPNPLVPIDTLGAGFHEVCLQVINEEGCVADICKNIEIDDIPFIWVPNSFTPNDDNLNEVFAPVISQPDLIEKYKFTIFNRIGHEIFSTEDMNDAWGRNLIKERDRQMGIYMWQVELKVKNYSEMLIISGTVKVLK